MEEVLVIELSDIQGLDIVRRVAQNLQPLTSLSQSGKQKTSLKIKTKEGKVRPYLSVRREYT